MDQPVLELEQSLSEFRGQVDRVASSLRRWRETQDQPSPVELRLAELTERCAVILDAWAATSDRHVHVVGELERRLESVRSVEERLQRDAALLCDQASSLNEVSIATANTAQAGFDRAQASLAAMQAEFSRWMAELSQEARTAPAPPHASDAISSSAQSAVAPALQFSVEVTHPQSAPPDPSATPAAKDAPPLPAAAPPLDRLADVTVRVTAGEKKEIADVVRAEDLPAHGQRLAEGKAEIAEALGRRVEQLERALTHNETEIAEVVHRTERARRINAVLSQRTAVALLVAGLVVGGGLVWIFQRAGADSTTRLAEIERRTQVAMETATRQMTEAREQAARESAEAKEAAASVRIMGDALTAPDLVRYALVGGMAAPDASGQLLWSRSRGLVLSASRLPQPPARTTYQLWLVTARAPFNAGTFMPDASGRATLATQSLPTVPGPVANVVVTLEPEGGRQMPTGDTFLRRAPLPAPVQ